MSSDVPSEDLKTFLDETEEQLHRLDEDIVRLERERVNPVLLQEIMHIIQALKQSCESLRHHEMAKVAEAMESIMERVASGAQPVGTQVIDALLDSLDTFITLRETLIDPQKQPASGEVAGYAPAGPAALPTETGASIFQEALAPQAEAVPEWQELRADISPGHGQGQEAADSAGPPSAPIAQDSVVGLMVQLAFARGIVERLARVPGARPEHAAPGGGEALAQVVGVLREAQTHVLDILAGDSVRLNALVISCCGVDFAIPLENVVQAVALDQGVSATPGAGESFSFQGKGIPLLRLEMLLWAAPRPEGPGHSPDAGLAQLPPGGQALGAIVTHGDSTAVLAADSLLGPRELLVRRFQGSAAVARCIGGAGVLESGEVVLLLDVAALMARGAPAESR